MSTIPTHPVKQIIIIKERKKEGREGSTDRRKEGGREEGRQTWIQERKQKNRDRRLESEPIGNPDFTKTAYVLERQKVKTGFCSST